MKLWIGRHAFAGASSKDPTRERERPLKPEGVAMAKAIAAAMVAVDEVPNAIFCSPYTRAIQTADIYGKAFKCRVNEVGDLAPDRPLAPRIADLISIKGKEKLTRLMIIGHVDNTTPAMRDLADDSDDQWDPLVMSEVRRVRIDRKSLAWDLKWGIKPSDLGLKDYDA